MNDSRATQAQVDTLKWAARAAAQRIKLEGWPKASHWPSVEKRHSRMLYIEDADLWLSDEGTIHRKMTLGGVVSYLPWPTVRSPRPSTEEVELIAKELENLHGSR